MATRLKKRSQSNAGEAETDEVALLQYISMRDQEGVRWFIAYSVAAAALAAGGSLLALIVEQVLQADKVKGYRCQSQFLSYSEIHTLEVKRGAVVGQANTLGAGSRANEAAQEARQETAVDVGGVTGISGLVAAGELVAATAGVGSLRDSHAGRGRDVVDSAAADGGLSHNHSGKSESSSSSELHCDGGVVTRKSARRLI